MTDWMAEAACGDLPGDVFQPERDPLTDRYTYSVGQIEKAKDICARCPVVRACVISDLRHTRMHYASASGMRGGLGGLGRRRLIAAMRDVDHPPERECTDADCAWCRAVSDHQLNLDVRAGRRPESDRVRIDLNTIRATHGRRSTFARGCRGGQCSAAISTRSFGPVDLAAMWEDLYPGLPNDSLCDDTDPVWLRERVKAHALGWVQQNQVAA